MRRYAIGGALLLWTLILNLYHLGVYPPPHVAQNFPVEALWMDRREAGINHLVLAGDAFDRGRRAGELTSALLLEQEDSLVQQLRTMIPVPRLSLQIIVLSSIALFQDAGKFLQPEFVQEMYGVSLSAPKKYDYLADGFTRQIAYHGLHEIGQMMVDQGFDDSGCTVAAVRWKNSFVIGRNFDFEAGRVFDRDKIVKWVFPQNGFAFVSVVWAGMVGAVTGVNEKGLYISLNAGGSADHRRIGTPSTLVLLDALEHAATAGEAVQIIQDAPMFITDIFAVLDAEGTFVRVEKSPKKTAVLPQPNSTVITNHLNALEFQDDKTNVFRKNELSTVARETRGLALIRALPAAKNSSEATDQVLAILRDKGVDENGQILPLGNRQAIDALIAMHSVIYDPFTHQLFVSQGPGVSGAFLGYDLTQSFATHRPVHTRDLPADPRVDETTFYAIRDIHTQIAQADHLVRAHNCDAAVEVLNAVPLARREQTYFHRVLGDAEFCRGHRETAQVEWKIALRQHPAYARETRQVQERLKR